MPYIPNTDAQRQEMLAAIGVSSMADLYQEVPASVIDPEIRLPEPLSESEVMSEMRRLSQLNADATQFAIFLGAGAYNQFVPAAVYRIMSRSEFYTAYTPYQPELSQGTLQWTYEFQTLICQLTGMDVANAGMYDASTGLGEAAIIATAITKRNKVVIAGRLHPHYGEVLKTYSYSRGIEIVTQPYKTVANGEIGADVACVIVQQPDFFGTIHDLSGMAEKAHAAGALFIVTFDPISLGMLRSPGELGADIAVGEGQPLGVPLQFGGPYSGLLAVSTKYMRQIPGRLAGITRDTRDGKRGYVLTLQTREQHIRREKATSNICTNSALMALCNTVYLSLMGPTGLKRIAEISYNRAHYLADRIGQIPGFKVANDGPFFREFLVETPIAPGEINRRLRDSRIIGGLDVSSAHDNGWLLAVTEMNTKAQLDGLVTALEGMAL